MENTAAGEAIATTSSTPPATASQRKPFDPVRDAYATNTAIAFEKGESEIQTAVPSAGDRGTVNPTKDDQPLGITPPTQETEATTQTSGLTSDIHPNVPLSTEPVNVGKSEPPELQEIHENINAAPLEQISSASHEHQAQLQEDHDEPPIDQDQMSEATSAPSMELYVDSQGDADSAFGDYSVLSSTQSLRPSVYDFVEENGRRFHRFRSGEYHLPNDETEQDRLDLQHHLMLLTLDGKLHLAPIENMEGGLHEVLDIATGTGIWAIEFANKFPSASVLGSDLSPIQPDFVPPNCRFEVDDVEDDWLYSHKFDYIHGRALALCFRSHKVVFQHAFNALRPGGWFEVQDVALPMVALDSTVTGTAVELWVSRLLEGGKALGKDFTRVPTYKNILQELGFVDVVERHFQWPVGTWAKGAKMKALGAWMREDMLSGIQGGSMGVMVKGLGMTVEEVERFLVDVRVDIKSNRIHSYFPVHVVYGRKPL